MIRDVRFFFIFFSCVSLLFYLYEWGHIFIWGFLLLLFWSDLLWKVFRCIFIKKWHMLYVVIFLFLRVVLYFSSSRHCIIFFSHLRCNFFFIFVFLLFFYLGIKDFPLLSFLPTKNEGSSGPLYLNFTICVMCIFF